MEGSLEEVLREEFSIEEDVQEVASILKGRSKIQFILSNRVYIFIYRSLLQYLRSFMQITRRAD